MRQQQLTTDFTQFGLCTPILKALASANHVTPTPIQTQAIPHALSGRDVFGIAQTGTGKTAAFALPIINRLLMEKERAMAKGCRALVLSPTRELASQIAESFRTYSRSTDLKIATIFGGVNAGPQIRSLARGVDVVVATPGRLLDHMRSGHCDLSRTGILVLDEADQMLDLGFLKPIQTIAAKTAPDRQSLFFSATLPKEIEALAQQLLNDPVSVRVTPVSSTAERVDQRVFHVEKARKAHLLVRLLSDPGMSRTLVFTRTKHGADALMRKLEKGGLNAAAIHGNKSQAQRERALTALRASRIQVLVATDIAARGIDIPEVSHVVNYDLPETPEAYVHRIGRTARAGSSGEAITLCDGSERKLLKRIEMLTKQSIRTERWAPSEDEGTAEHDAQVNAGSEPEARRDEGHRGARAPRPPREPHQSANKPQRSRKPQAAGDTGVGPDRERGPQEATRRARGGKPKPQNNGDRPRSRRRRSPNGSKPAQPAA